MTARRRLVLDTNLLVSGMLFGGSTPREAILKAEKEGLLLTSNETLAELLEVFLRPQFDRAASPRLRHLLYTEYIQRCTLISVHSMIKAYRDVKDDKFLKLAVDGRADLVVSGISICLRCIRSTGFRFFRLCG